MARKKLPKIIYEKKIIHDSKKVWGLADSDKNTIQLDLSLKGKKHLEILLHEMIHMICPFFTEEKVEEDSIYYANILWKENYRRVEVENSEPMQDGKP